jgi:NAD+ kinase
MIYIKPWD